MKTLIDADGCPVVKQTIEIAKENKIEVVVFCDTSHIINSDYAKTVTVSKGADSVDFALVNQVSPGDIVVTQDYGLSAMVLSKGGKPITQNGLIINDSNLTHNTPRIKESKNGRRPLKRPKEKNR